MNIIIQLLAGAVKNQFYKAYTPEEIKEMKDQNISDFMRDLSDANFRTDINDLSTTDNAELLERILDLVNSTDVTFEDNELFFPSLSSQTQENKTKVPFSGQNFSNLIAICHEAIRRRNNGSMDEPDVKLILDQLKRYTSLTDKNNTTFIEFFLKLSKPETNNETRRIR